MKIETLIQCSPDDVRKDVEKHFAICVLCVSI